MSLIPRILSVYTQFSKYPFGKYLFSQYFSYMAPYFRTINPLVEELKPGYAQVSMKQRWSVQNHIKTVHAIAVCNLIEMALGLIAESTIPDHLRWLPMGMDVDYLKKASGKLTAKSTIDPNTFFVLKEYPGRVDVPVEVFNTDGVVVTKGHVKLWISLKPDKKKEK